MKPNWLRGQPQNIEKIIMGLGNPGQTYATSRHNAGFMGVSRLAKDIRTSFDKKEGQARTAHGTIGGTPVLLARPQTYMNLSGQAAVGLLAKYRLTSADLIVIHDDIDLRLGQLRIRCGGRSGGHRGIASVINELGREDFIRVRLGVGRPEASGSNEAATSIADYVLDNFSAAEELVIAETTVRTAEAVRVIVTNGLEAAMTAFNRAPDEPKPS